MENISDFEKFIRRVHFTPRKLAEINNLIFYNWNEKEGKQYFPENIVRMISDIQNNDPMLNQVFDCLKSAIVPKEMA
jgi:hypothetical protein